MSNGHGGAYVLNAKGERVLVEGTDQKPAEDASSEKPRNNHDHTEPAPAPAARPGKSRRTEG